MDWIAGNSLNKSSPYTRQQQQSTMHAVNIYNTQYIISYSKGNNSSIQWQSEISYIHLFLVICVNALYIYIQEKCSCSVCQEL